MRAPAHERVAGTARRLLPLLLVAFGVTASMQATAAAASSAANEYRLAGVMLVGKDRIGLLEVPAGGPPNRVYLLPNQD